MRLFYSTVHLTLEEDALSPAGDVKLVRGWLFSVIK